MRCEISEAALEKVAGGWLKRGNHCCQLESTTVRCSIGRQCDLRSWSWHEWKLDVVKVIPALARPGVVLTILRGAFHLRL